MKQSTGEELFVVLSVGGVLGLAAKEVALPLAEFDQNQEEPLVLPDMTENELKNMPPYNHALYVSVAK